MTAATINTSSLSWYEASARQRIDGYMFDVEVLHLAARSGYRIKEIGVSWRDDGDSRLQLVRGNWRNFLDILRIRFGRSRPSAPVQESSPFVSPRELTVTQSVKPDLNS